MSHWRVEGRPPPKLRHTARRSRGRHRLAADQSAAWLSWRVRQLGTCSDLLPVVRVRSANVPEVCVPEVCVPVACVPVVYRRSVYRRSANAPRVCVHSACVRSVYARSVYALGLRARALAQGARALGQRARALGQRARALGQRARGLRALGQRAQVCVHSACVPRSACARSAWLPGRRAKACRFRLGQHPAAIRSEERAGGRVDSVSPRRRTAEASRQTSPFIAPSASAPRRRQASLCPRRCLATTDRSAGSATTSLRLAAALPRRPGQLAGSS